MFNEFEDYVLGAAAIYGAVLAGIAIHKEYEDYAKAKAEDGIEYIRLAGDRWKHVLDKINAANVKPAVRLEAFEHCHMLLNRHIEFNCLNEVAKKKAHAFNDSYYYDLVKIWK